MSYICNGCLKAQPIKSKPTRVVTEYRNRTYVVYDKYGREQLKAGKEIVSEADLCPKCAANFQGA